MARYEITNEAAEIPFEENREVQRILQNAKNLLMTRMGEVPFDRLRGFDTSLFDLPMNEFRMRLIREVDRVLLWEPRCVAVSANAWLNTEHETVIRVIVEIEEAV